MTVPRFLLAALVLFMTAGAPVLAQYDYAVQGVAADDVLNVRENVAGASDISSSRIVARIPADAKDVKGTGRTIMVGKTRWHEIVYEGVTGWANGRYLQDISGNMTSPPYSLMCSGAEPFWSLDFTTSPPTYRNPAGRNGDESHRMVVLEMRLANGRPNIWALALKSETAHLISTAVLRRTDQCSDGMSDFLYPIEIDFVAREGHVNMWHGCCTLKR